MKSQWLVLVWKIFDLSLQTAAWYLLELHGGNQLLGAVKCWNIMVVTSFCVLWGAGTSWWYQLLGALRCWNCMVVLEVHGGNQLLGAVGCWNFILVISCWVL